MIGKIAQQLSTEETRDPEVADNKARFEPRAWDCP